MRGHLQRETNGLEVGWVKDAPAFGGGPGEGVDPLFVAEIRAPGIHPACSCPVDNAAAAAPPAPPFASASPAPAGRTTFSASRRKSSQRRSSLGSRTALLGIGCLQNKGLGSGVPFRLIGNPQLFNKHTTVHTELWAVHVEVLVASDLYSTRGQGEDRWKG